MVRIAPIKLYYNPKTLWFDPCDLDLHAGDAVVVETARGTEFGFMSDDAFEADEAQVKKLKTPLKPVKRLATDEDRAAALEMERKSTEALPIFKEMAAEANADMHPVTVEYLLDGDKAVFYFEAEERVDFRDLVRKLAARFHVRVDMRQIGVRDEARMVGGLGHCGQELCCKRLGGEFCPVSIRMAKEQDLSLNPQKISGVCGRLMCCLRYEYDAYKDFKSRAPKVNASIETPEGTAKVTSLDVPREVVTVKLEGEKPVKVPLSAMDAPEEGARPKSIGEEAWEEATSQGPLAMAGETSFLTSQFTGADKLADPSAVRRSGSGGKGRQKSRGGSGGASGSGSESGEGRKPRRRRSTKVGGDGAEAAQGGSGNGGGSGKRKRQGGQQGKKKQGGGQNGQGGQGQGGKGRGQGGAKGEGARKQGGRGKQDGARGGAKGQGGGPRPGQKSSGLRQARAEGGASRAEGTAASGDGGHRTKRRRSHKANGGEAGGSGAASGGAGNPPKNPEGGAQ